VLRLPEGEDDEELACRLLIDDHVVVQPGFYFDFPEGDHVVLSLLTPADEFAEGVRLLAARLMTRHSALT
jgi:aspartate/methionine/tyrosine aminotransferase